MKNDQTHTFSAPAAIKSGIPSGRRTLLAAAALLSLGGPALAQNDPAAGFPSHPVTVITAFAVGSGPDAVLRIVGEKLAARWKQSVTVDNRPGGGGFGGGGEVFAQQQKHRIVFKTRRRVGR